MTEVQEVVKEMPRSPKVGDTVAIRHRVKTNKRGEVGLEPCKAIFAKVKTVFLDGDVMVGDDLWAVKKATDGKSDWWTHAEAQREVRV